MTTSSRTDSIPCRRDGRKERERATASQDDSLRQSLRLSIVDHLRNRLRIASESGSANHCLTSRPSSKVEARRMQPAAPTARTTSPEWRSPMRKAPSELSRRSAHPTKSTRQGKRIHLRRRMHPTTQGTNRGTGSRSMKKSDPHPGVQLCRSRALETYLLNSRSPRVRRASARPEKRATMMATDSGQRGFAASDTSSSPAWRPQRRSDVQPRDIGDASSRLSLATTTHLKRKLSASVRGMTELVQGIRLGVGHSETRLVGFGHSDLRTTRWIGRRVAPSI